MNIINTITLALKFGAGVNFYILCGKKETNLAMHD